MARGASKSHFVTEKLIAGSAALFPLRDGHNINYRPADTPLRRAPAVMSHAPTSHRFRHAAVLALTLFASLLSCGREITGPGGRGAMAQLSFAPSFSSMIDEVDGTMSNVAALLPFNRVRIELRRVDNSIAASQVVDFPETATEVPLTVQVQLSSAAGRDGETLTAFLRYINAGGDTVFSGGPLSVTAVPASSGTPPQAVEIPVVPSAPGAVFASIDISPDSASGIAGTTLTFTATGFDAQRAVVPNAIIGFISRNPAVATVPNLAQGTVNLVGVRGETWIVAQSLTNLRDSARVKVLPVPSQIAKISGDAQTALQGVAFSQALRVRVLASDNLPVAGTLVTFAVTAGGGTLSATSVLTDTAGYAQVTWTAGSALGAATVTASVGNPAITATFTGSQVNAGPTSLAFETEPVAIISGDTLPQIRVAVRNALGQTISNFTGVVSLSRVGTGGGRLVGDTAVAAVAGVATFRGLTVDRPGTDYRLVAVLDGVPTQLSSIFTVTVAPPTAITLVSGGGQFSDPNTALPAPVVVRVLNVFAQPVVGATVTFAVHAGGGSVTPATASTDANGQASTQWTLGQGGVQTLRATVGSLTPLDVAAGVNNVGGPAVLFAGYDSALVRIGQSRSVPIYLSNRADSTITATLSSSDGGVQWASGTVQFSALSRQVNVNLAVSASTAPGTYWARIASSAGNDSIKITVDSAFVQLADPYWTFVARKDTVHLPLRLSDPAPAGGITVRVKSLVPQLAQVIAGTGAGIPVPSCLSAEYCYYGSLQTTLGVPGDSVDITIAAGELLGHVAFIVKDTAATGNLGFQATALSHKSSSVSFFLQTYALNVFGDAVSVSGVGVGQLAYGYVQYPGGEITRDRRINLRSLTPSIFSVDSAVVVRRLSTYSTDFELRGLATGSGQLEYGSVDSGYDTVAVVVRNARVRLSGSANAAFQTTTALTVSVGPDSTTSNLRAGSDVPVTIVSRSPNVIAIDQASTTIVAGEYTSSLSVRMVGLGSSWIVATAPGHRTDSLLVGALSAPLAINTSGRSIGVGTSMPWTLSLTGRFGAFGPSRTVEARPRNAAISRLVAPFVQMSDATNGQARFEVVGLSIGVDTMDFFFGDTLVASANYSVNQPRVLLSTLPQNVEPDSTFTYNVGAFVADDSSRARLAADTVHAILRSSNPSVIRVVDSTFSFHPGEMFTESSRGGSWVALQPGTATLTLSAPGFTSGTQTQTVVPYRLLVTFPASGSTVAGIGALNSFGLRRNSATTDSLPLTITHQGPGRIAFVQALSSILKDNELIFEYFTGVTVGVDTVIFSALNHAPDTMIVQVFTSSARLSADPNVAAGEFDEFIGAFLRVSEGSFFASSQTRRFQVVSRDSTKARVEQDTIILSGASGVSRYAEVRYLEGGSVTLVMTDLDGISPPDSVTVAITPRRLYGWTDWDQSYLPIGMRQRSYDENMYVELDFAADKDLWVRFSSTRPGLISLPDSVKIPAGESYAYFNVAAGDTTGSTRVTASIPGFIPWEFDVMVTRTLIEMYPSYAFVGGTSDVGVYPVDALELYSRPLAVATSFRLTSDRPEIASVILPEFTVAADSDYVEVRAVRGQAIGSALLRITDARSNSFSEFAPYAREVTIYRPQLFPGADQFLASPSLETTGGDHVVNASEIRDSVWVRLTSKQGRFQPMQDSLLLDFTNPGVVIPELNNVSETGFGLRGLSAGIDTLVFSATGYPTTEAQVRIEPGILVLAPGTPTIITVGDSTLIRATFAGASGVSGAKTSAPITFTHGFVSGATQQAVVPAGSTSVQFWVKASSAGFGTFEISAPGFRPLRVTVEGRARP